MKQVYAIAEDVWVIEHGEEVVETRVAHNLGVFVSEIDANLRCTTHNAESMGDEDDAETFEDRYYVLPLDLK